MKLIALILALFFTGLSLTPCSDAHVEKNDVEIVFEKSANQSHDAEPDLCSPFCVCHCCHSHFVATNLFYGSVPTLPQMIKKTGYKVFLPNGYSTSILQPPRV